MRHQRLRDFDGSMYPTNLYSRDPSLVQSPGGMSTTDHHYSGGLYGEGLQRSDKFGGEGYAYQSGEYGNLYQTGQTASEQEGYYARPTPDVPFWENKEPTEDSSFEVIEGFEFEESKKEKFKSLLLLIVFAVITYLVLNMWSTTLHKFLEQRIHNFRQITYGRMALYSLGVTLVFFIILWFYKPKELLSL